MFGKLAKGIGFLVLGLFVLGVIGAMFGDDKPKPSDRPSAVAAASGSSATVTAPAQAIKVTAAQLRDDYEANEVAADQRYKGKWLHVGGTVQSIDKDAFDNIVVRLRTSNQFMSVMASLSKEHEGLAASLNKGAKLVFECKGGGMVIGSPVLRDCAPI